MKQTAFVFGLVGLLLSTARANTSSYTKLGKQSCQVVESHGEGAYELQTDRASVTFATLRDNCLT